MSDNTFSFAGSGTPDAAPAEEVSSAPHSSEDHTALEIITEVTACSNSPTPSAATAASTAAHAAGGPAVDPNRNPNMVPVQGGDGMEVGAGGSAVRGSKTVATSMPAGLTAPTGNPADTRQGPPPGTVPPHRGSRVGDWRQGDVAPPAVRADHELPVPSTSTPTRPAPGLAPAEIRRADEGGDEIARVVSRAAVTNSTKGDYRLPSNMPKARPKAKSLSPSVVRMQKTRAERRGKASPERRPPEEVKVIEAFQNAKNPGDGVDRTPTLRRPTYRNLLTDGDADDEESRRSIADTYLSGGPIAGQMGRPEMYEVSENKSTPRSSLGPRANTPDPLNWLADDNKRRGSRSRSEERGRHIDQSELKPPLKY